MSFVTYGQGFAGNVAFKTPSGGGTFPAPGREFNLARTSADIEDSDDSPAGGRGTYGTPGAVPSPPGPGQGWTGIYQQLALAGGQAIIGRLFGGGDSRSTKDNGVVPAHPVAGDARPTEGHAYPRGEFSEPTPPAPGAQPGAKMGGVSPLVLAAAAAAVLLLFMFARR